MALILKRFMARLLGNGSRVYHGTEMYGPTCLPWQEVLRRKTSCVPGPKEKV